MFASFAGIIKFVLLATLWLFFLAAFVLYTKSMIDRFSSKVMIGAFADINDGSKDLSPYLISRAAELSRPVSLDALYEVKVPPIVDNFGAKDDLKFLDDVKLSFQGVDVPGVVRSFFSILPDDQYVISAKPANVGASGPALQMELKAPSDDHRSWLLRAERPVPGGTTPPPAAATTSQIVDRAIYTIWYHMYYDPKGLRRRENLEANFTSARALEAYYGGQQRLVSYQHTFEPGDLDDAEKEFRLLISEMPQFVPGLMLLGTTLLEKRSEADAIRIFERAQRLLAPNKTLPSDATAADRKTWLQARLFVAVARLQMYGWQHNHDALRILEGIIPDIPDTLTEALNRRNLYDYRNIRFSVLSQIAHTVGHDLVLLNETNFVDALTEPPDSLTPARPTVPISVRPVDPARQETLRLHENAVRNAANEGQLALAKRDRVKDFGEEIDRIFAKQQQLKKNAQNFLALIDGLVDERTKPPDELNKEEWKRVKARYLGDLQNADGYARFRYAQARALSDREFGDSCQTALLQLTEALAARPNEYTIIQNLALIYTDPRFDPTGNEIETARALFSRSLEIKPRDYYGYQQLATLAIRQAYQWGPEFISLDAVKAAITQAEKARQLRPDEGTVYALLAQLYVLKWSKTTGNDQLEPAALVEASLAAAQRFGANSIHIRMARLQWQLTRLRASASKDEFDKAKPKVLADLDIAQSEVKGNPRWRAADLSARAKQLLAQLKTLHFEDRFSLKWLN
jgi:hypothetical protein